MAGARARLGRTLTVLGSLAVTPATGVAEQVCNEDGRPGTAPAGRFSDQGDGTITDTRASLTWKRCSEGQTWESATCTGVASTYTWQRALHLAGTASYAGKDDWRLPELKELASIVERACHSPAIDLVAFPATPSAWYWSSRAVTSCSGGAWGISFGHGEAGSDDEGSANHVRLVRGGP